MLAFKLGGKASPPETAALAERKPIERAGHDATVSRGLTIFDNYCAVCHRDAAIGGGLITDLRWSTLASDRDA